MTSVKHLLLALLAIFSIINDAACSSDPYSETPLEPEVGYSTFPATPLRLCSQDQSIFFLLDLSGTLSKQNRQTRFNKQSSYIENVMDAFAATNTNLVRFQVSAYSKFSANIRSLRNPKSDDVEYMKKSIRSFKVFTKGNWDTRNGYKLLTRQGKCDSAI